MNNCKAEDLLLYAVTDRSWTGKMSLYEQVEAALKGGATFVQLREKELDDEAFLKEAIEIGELCKKYQVPFVINDNVEVALKCGADGVHVGQSDMEAGTVREKLGADKIIGVSCKTVEQALLAQSRGADYLGVGALFSTGTKTDASVVTKQALEDICKAVDIPVVGIGGLKLSNLEILEGTGAAGAAVVSAIFASEDPQKASEALKEKLQKII